MSYFILGQIGIAATVLFSMGIVQVQSQQLIRPPWYYFLAVWGVGITACFMFSSGYTYPGQDKLPPSIYVFRFVLGCERLLAWYWLRYRSTATLSSLVIDRTNHVLSIVSVLVMVTALGYGTIYTKLQANSVAIQKLGRVATVLPDTSRLAQLQADNDSLRADLKLLQAASVVREKQINGLKTQIEELTDLILSLKNLIKMVGLNVERARRGSILMPPVQQSPPAYSLPLIRLPDPVREKRGRRTGWIDGADSSYFARTKITLEP